MQTIVWSMDLSSFVRNIKKLPNVLANAHSTRTILVSEEKAVKEAFSVKNKEVQQWWV
jgi:hypothetical protein